MEREILKKAAVFFAKELRIYSREAVNFSVIPHPRPCRKTFPTIVFLRLSMTSTENNTAHDFWHLHIMQWQASGLSQASYCRQQALLTHQFSYWKRQFLADREPVDPEPKAGFARVQVATHVATLCCGHVMTGND